MLRVALSHLQYLATLGRPWPTLRFGPRSSDQSPQSFLRKELSATSVVYSKAVASAATRTKSRVQKKKPAEAELTLIKLASKPRAKCTSSWTTGEAKGSGAVKAGKKQAATPKVTTKRASPQKPAPKTTSIKKSLVKKAAARKSSTKSKTSTSRSASSKLVKSRSKVGKAKKVSPVAKGPARAGKAMVSSLEYHDIPPFYACYLLRR